jgi:hypothetical protein
MAKLSNALEGGASGGASVPFVRIDGATDSRDRLEVCLSVCRCERVRSDLSAVGGSLAIRLNVCLSIRQATRRFRDDAAIRVALLSVTAAGTGLDFSSASHVVFAELPPEVALVR